MSKYVMKREMPQVPDWEEGEMAEAVGRDLLTYLAPLLMRLEEVLDKRVVRTFAQTVLAIVRNRDRARCLVQTELGALLLGADKARAGAKRLRTLLGKLIWKSSWIGEWLLEEAERAVKQWEAQGVTPIAAWDGSVLEKHESAAGEGLCPVHSSKAARAATHAQGLLPSAGGTHLCARLAVVGRGLNPPHSDSGASEAFGDAFLDDARGPAQLEAR
jgi:hypothetical protein